MPANSSNAVEPRAGKSLRALGLETNVCGVGAGIHYPLVRRLASSGRNDPAAALAVFCEAAHNARADAFRSPSPPSLTGDDGMSLSALRAGRRGGL